MDLQTQKKLAYLEETKQLIREAIEEKGQTVADADSFRSYAGKILAITGGGGSDELRYVTFMNDDGTVEYGRKAVATGDDCADPIARGIFSTPTKESSVQYNYTFAGWATTPNGGKDSNALKAVTEDRTVYANFASTVRFYTVTFYDSDGTTVLKTEKWAYGMVPSYTPIKNGYDFVGWNPTPVAVTGDVSYTASWKEKAGFATASWAEISAITTAGTSSSYFAVGDRKDEVLTYSDGTTENIELIIVKIREDGSMVLALNHALSTLKPMHSSASTSNLGYYNNDLGKYLLNTVLPAFSEDFSAVLRDVEVTWIKRKIRLLTMENILQTYPTTTDLEKEAIPFLATNENRIRKQNGTAVTYWLGTSRKGSGSSYYYYDHVTTTGEYQNCSSFGAANGLTGERGVVFVVDV